MRENRKTSLKLAEPHIPLLQQPDSSKGGVACSDMFPSLLTLMLSAFFKITMQLTVALIVIVLIVKI